MTQWHHSLYSQAESTCRNHKKLGSNSLPSFSPCMSIGFHISRADFSLLGVYLFRHLLLCGIEIGMSVNHLPPLRFTAIDVGHTMTDDGRLPHDHSPPDSIPIS